MQTFNISVTKEQSDQVEKLVKEMGFANRSEFFRSLLRNLLAEERFFVPPPKMPLKKAMADFSKTGRYSREFLQDLKRGLQRAKIFQ